MMCPSMKPLDNGQHRDYAVEAKRFSEDNILLQEVLIGIQGLDKIGTFLGQIYIIDQQNQRKNQKKNQKPDAHQNNYACSLLKSGLATLRKRIVEKFKDSELRNQLFKAEAVARNQELKLWIGFKEREKIQIKNQKSYTEFKLCDNDTEFPIRVTEVIDVGHLYIQTDDAAGVLKGIEESILRLNVDKLPKVDQCQLKMNCFAKFSQDKQWYRARIDEIIYHKSGPQRSKKPQPRRIHQIKVTFIDYGNSDCVKPSELRQIPPGDDILKFEPPVKEVYLAHIRLPPRGVLLDMKNLIDEQLGHIHLSETLRGVWSKTKDAGESLRLADHKMSAYVRFLPSQIDKLKFGQLQVYMANAGEILAINQNDTEALTNSSLHSQLLPSLSSDNSTWIRESFDPDTFALKTAGGKENLLVRIYNSS